MNVSIGVLLAPYRVDFYNYLHEHYNFSIYFQVRTFSGQLYSTDELEKQCHFTPKYLKPLWLRGRVWAKGLRQVVETEKPNYILVPEFCIATFQLIFMKLIHRYKYHLISLCDDSYNMISEGGFTKMHGYIRRFCLHFLKNIILTDLRAAKWYQENYNKGIWLPLIQDDNRLQRNIIGIKEKFYEYKMLWNLYGKKVILFVGRLIEEKNLPVLFDACSRLNMPYKIIVVGEGVCRNKWTEMAKEKNIPIVFVGQLNGIDLFAWYYTADVLVLPSTIEPFGAVTNEALIFGCNCCVSEKAGSACLIEEGVNGYIFNPKDQEDLYKKMLLTFELPRDHTSKMKFSFTNYMDKAFKLALS